MRSNLLCSNRLIEYSEFNHYLSIFLSLYSHCWQQPIETNAIQFHNAILICKLIRSVKP